MNGKIETYIGFAIKKGSVVYGCDNILQTRSLSDNSQAVLKITAEQRGCPLRQIDDYDALAKRNCKALAICDKSLAAAILDNLA